MIHLIEPQWGVALSQSLFAWMQASAFWYHLMPVLADIFVLTYPVYLLALYGYGMLLKWRENTEQWQWYKTSWIYILMGTILTAVVNLGVQYFFDKARPNVVLWLADLKHETIIHKFLPSSSFPSDHAAVSMAIAMSSLLRGIQKKDKKYIRFGIILVIFSLITSFARVTTAVHWITDVIGGTIVGILVPLVLLNKNVSQWVEWLASWIGRIV